MLKLYPYASRKFIVSEFIMNRKGPKGIMRQSWRRRRRRRRKGGLQKYI